MTDFHPGQALVRLLHPDGRPEGGGVLVAPRLVVTCDHVVGNLVQCGTDQVSLDFPLLAPGESLPIRVKKCLPASVRPKAGQPDDLAVLEFAPDIPLPSGARPAPLLPAGESAGFDRQVRMMGFPDPKAPSRWARGTLTGPTDWGYVQFDAALTSRAVTPGFSGTPVWDVDSHKVAGIVVGTDTDDGKSSAYMIPTAILFDAVAVEVKTAGRPVGSVAPGLCNREDEDLEFWEHFFDASENCATAPQFYILPGLNGSCHESLIRRFRDTHIRGYLTRKRPMLGPAPEAVSVPWPDRGPMNSRQRQLKENLTLAFDPHYNGPGESVASLVKRMDLGVQGVHILTHNLYLERWERLHGDLLTWYIGEYWRGFGCKPDDPLFLVFFNLVCMGCNSGSGVSGLKWRLFRKPAVERGLRQVRKALPNDLPCLVFKELGFVTETDVHKWFNRHGHCLPLLEQDRLDRVKDLFGSRSTLSMAEVEKFLVQLWEKPRPHRSDFAFQR